MVRTVLALALAATALAGAPLAAYAQSSVTGRSSVTGQQNNQPSANQNQSQQQTDQNQQPAQARVLPPSADAQAQPNPLPQLSR